ATTRSGPTLRSGSASRPCTRCCSTGCPDWHRTVAHCWWWPGTWGRTPCSAGSSSRAGPPSGSPAPRDSACCRLAAAMPAEHDHGDRPGGEDPANPGAWNNARLDRVEAIVRAGTHRRPNGRHTMERTTMATYTLPDLPYDYGALAPHIAPEIMELHHSKHHQTYVNGANTALDQLAEARANGDLANVNKLEKDLAFNLGGHVNHSVFWKNMSPDGGGEPTGDVAAAIDEFFGGFEGFKKQFAANAAGIQ